MGKILDLYYILHALIIHKPLSYKQTIVFILTNIFFICVETRQPTETTDYTY